MATTVWVSHQSLKIRDITLPPASPSTTVNLFAAKNEFTAFQVSVYDTASAIDISLGSGLAGLTLTYYREDFYNCTIATGGDGATGNWPDILLPKVDPYYSEARNTFPFNGTAGKTRTIWVDIQVPANATAGAITGVINVSIGGVNTPINVTVNVWNFGINSTATMRSTFAMVWNAQINAVGTDPISGDANAMLALRALYVRCFLDHRISIQNPDGGQLGSPPAAAWTNYDNTTAGPFLSGSAPTRLVGAKLTCAQIEPALNTANVQAWGAHFRSKGWNQLFAYCFDEPQSVTASITAGSRSATVSSAIFATGDTVTVEGAGSNGADLVTTVSSASGVNLILADLSLSTDPYAAIVKAGTPNGQWPTVISNLNTVQAADSSIPRLVTAAIETARVQGCTNISLFSPVLDLMWNKPGRHNAGNHRSDYSTTSPVFWYESCDSWGCGNPSSETGWASYAIDHTAIRNRCLEWMSFANNIQGELYYEVAYNFAGNPYTNNVAFGGNGDGTLFYWGRPSVIGGTHHIPIESIRMKQIRAGMQDYELLTLAAANGRQTDAVNLALSLFPNTYTTSATTDQIDSARTTLSGWILAPAPSGGGSPVTSSGPVPGGFSSSIKIKQLTKINTGDVLLDRVQQNIIGVLNPILRTLPQAADFQLVELQSSTGQPPTYTLQVRGSTGWVTLDTFDSLGNLTVNGLAISGGVLSPSTDAKKAQSGALYMGSGVPANGNGNNGDFYFRTDTPGTANQRLYVRSAGAWVGIV